MGKDEMMDRMQRRESGELDVWKWRLRKPGRGYVLLGDGLSSGGKYHGIVKGRGHGDAWEVELTGNWYASLGFFLLVSMENNECTYDGQRGE